MRCAINTINVQKNKVHKRNLKSLKIRIQECVWRIFNISENNNKINLPPTKLITKAKEQGEAAKSKGIYRQLLSV